MSHLHEIHIHQFFSDDETDIFPTSLLISYRIFSSSILSSIVMISFYIISKRFFQKCKRLSSVREVPLTKKECRFAVLKVNI